MRLLFEIDTRDYDPSGTPFIRHSARCIHIKNGLVAMVHSLKYDYYKFPGGGIENGETPIHALIRETQEEAGLTVIPESVTEYGYVHRVQKSNRADFFLQDNFYYLCQVEETVSSQKLDPYEAEEAFTLEYVQPDYAISINRNRNHGPKQWTMIEREAKVLELLKQEGYFQK